MALKTDTILGSYKIESLIGKGGMGEVYRALDSGLDRHVAIKILPPSFASNTERVARFEREARLLATLSHQNIAGIYGFEETNGTRYLVLELVEGETLQDHLKKSTVPIEETLRICRQIADAVSAAHERGIIHRDLKPANIMITADDTIKILDFGIAKALDPTAADPAQEATLSAVHRTAVGTMVGTPTYMSPEQARGKPIDKRSDIWSFGCVLYECLTGQTAFGGETVTDTLARVLEREPDFSRVPETTPLAVQMVLRRCLQKDRKKRLQDIGDARVQIEEAIADPTGTTLGLSGSYLAVDAPRRKSLLPWLCAGLFALLSAVAWWQTWTSPGQSMSVVPSARLAFVSTDAELDWEEAGYDISPDGRSQVFRARPPSPDNAVKPPYQLFLRRIDEFESTPIPGTERASRPRFSPSGRWIAFHTHEPSSGRQLLKRVALDGSPALTICDLTNTSAGTFIWLTEDTLFLSILGADVRGKATVSVETGVLKPVQLTTEALGDFGGIWLSSVLPGGTRALGTIFRKMGTRIRYDSVIVSLEDWSCRKVLDNARDPMFAASGHLVFQRDRALLAAPFDNETGKVIGSVMPLISGVEAFAMAQSGVLVYHPIAGTLDGRRLMTVDTQGKTEPLSLVKRAFRDDLTLSPDGRWLSVTAWKAGEVPRIWLYELHTGLIRPVTPHDEICLRARLSHDGRRVAYFRWDTQKPAIMIASTDGTGEAKELLSTDPSSGWTVVDCWTNDDRAVLITQSYRTEKDGDILRLDLDSGETTPLVVSAAGENAASLSPDGRLFLYWSDATGERHIHIRAYDAESGTVGPSIQVTTENGASNASWSPDGGQIYFVDKRDHLLTVQVTTDPELSVSGPETVLDVGALRAVKKQIISLPGGKRFVFIQKGDQEKEAKHFNVVLNWLEELNRKVPAR